MSRSTAILLGVMLVVPGVAGLLVDANGASYPTELLVHVQHVQLTDPQAILHFGTNFECSLQLMRGPNPPYLETTCPIIERGMNASLAAENAELRASVHELNTTLMAEKEKVVTLESRVEAMESHLGLAPPSTPPPRSLQGLGGPFI